MLAAEGVGGKARNEEDLVPVDRVPPGGGGKGPKRA